jgi:hypothetical protein
VSDRDDLEDARVAEVRRLAGPTGRVEPLEGPANPEPEEDR